VDFAGLGVDPVRLLAGKVGEQLPPARCTWRITTRWRRFQRR
jgi:hypothetical protein